jgi:hypothetical protein
LAPENLDDPAKLRDAAITEAQCPVGAAVCVHAKGMKEPW